MSRLIANTLRDKRYFASPGWLSDFEAQGILPRQIHKLLTVCVLYSVRFQQLLNSFGISLIDGSTAIPDEWFVDLDGSSLSVDDITHSSPEHEGGFLTTLLERFGDVPLFLRRSFSSLCGLSEVTLRDIFWVGGQREPLHPLLVGAFFVVVDRRKRRPRISPGKSPWEQPVYLLARRDGSYVLSSCSLADSTIVLHPYVEGFLRSQRLRNRVDAHILGQVVTVVRSLPSPP
jgi:hypothetical protein